MVDMSCSMYSYGALEGHRLAGRQIFIAIDVNRLINRDFRKGYKR